MRLRMCHLTLGLLSLYLVYSSAQEVLPLPTVNEELVRHFRLALDAIFGIGIRLQALLEDEHNDNFLVSPISAAVVIGQLILGAEGEFREQLVELLSLPNSHLYENDKMNYYGKEKNTSHYLPYSTLHLQLSNLLKVLESRPQTVKHFILKQKSAVFVNDKITLKHDFVRNLQNIYLARLDQLDFVGKPLESQKHINNWAVKNTNGLIRTILNQPPTSETASIFANAVYFLAEWEIPFSDILNRKGPFNVSATKQSDVTYMIGFLEQILYAESSNYRMIALPYKNEELGMYIILPKSDDPNIYNINEFAQTLKFREILETIAKARRRDVVVKIPKMTVSNSFSILDQLKKYRVYKKNEVKRNVTTRMNIVDKLEDKVDAPEVTTNLTNRINIVDRLQDKVEAFNNFTTDVEKDLFLTNAAVNTTLRINDIVQQVVVNVNEKGTEAAAISASTIDYIGGSKNFIIERPFVFFIRHEATSATLFWGAIGNPAA